ncbi:hypothetical protein RJ639_039614 [Escallonia herrerae]|uniref:Transcription factor MYC/MYB N-terminal domain-containing protein n=1 Tax=Escallonia herrerae TaxID=1293975 RepID=A0AA88WK92_9ASTE|nr:hypothetical protein RJ639_039614 [Escallonia herrerae]
MVGSGSTDRSKEAVGMMALHEALRTVCLNSDWTYSVFWTIRPRPRIRGGNGCKVGDDNGSLMLMWEDGFCRGRVAECIEEIDGEDPVRKAFSKMSIQLYNYGEGWLPPEWTDQFESGIQIPEDLHFVLRMRHTFESLGYQSGFYLSQLFSSNRNSSSSSAVPLSKPTIMPTRVPTPLFNWGPRPLPSTNSVLPSPNYQNPARLGFPQSKDETHMFLLPHSSEAPMEDMMGDHESDIKWPNGLTFFNALTGRSDDAKLLFNPEGLGTKPDQNLNSDASSLHNNGGSNPNEFLSLDSNPEGVRKMENKYKRSFTLPARMASSSSSTSLDHHPHNPGDYRNSDTGMYSDVMGTFLE